MRGRWTQFNKGRARRAPGTATRAEKAFAGYLERRLVAGELAGYLEKPCKLRLARSCFYEPDALMVDALDLVVTFVEIKGKAGWSLDDEGRTKWKVAGELFPCFRFLGAVQGKDGGWSFEEYEPVRAPFRGSGELP